MSVFAWILLVLFILFFVFEVFMFIRTIIKKKKEQKYKKNTDIEVNNVVKEENFEDHVSSEDLNSEVVSH